MSNSEFVIPFIGLKTGLHVFEFEVSDLFFEEIEYSIISRGNVHVRLELEKKETMLIGTYQVEGLVTTDCDRCTEDIDVEVEGEYQIIYKCGGDVSDDEALIVLDKDAFEIDVKLNVYELISVSLPVRKIHEKNDCNPEMIALLDQYVINSSEEEEEDYEEEEDEEDEEEEEDFQKQKNPPRETPSADKDNKKDDDDIDPRWSILKDLN
jgi:uncharacterized protein